MFDKFRLLDAKEVVVKLPALLKEMLEFLTSKLSVVIFPLSPLISELLLLA